MRIAVNKTATKQLLAKRFDHFLVNLRIVNNTEKQFFIYLSQKTQWNSQTPNWSISKQMFLVLGQTELSRPKS